MTSPLAGRSGGSWPLVGREHQAGQDWERSALGLYVPPRRRRRYLRPVAVDLFAGAGGFSLGLHQAGFHVAAALEYDPWAAITYTVNLGRPWNRGGVQFHYDNPKREAAMEKTVAKHLGIQDGKDTGRSASRPEGRGGQLVQGGLLVGTGWISQEPRLPDGCEHFWVADARNVTGAEILAALGLDVGEVDLVVGGPPCQGFSKAGRRQVLDPRNSLIFEFARLILELHPTAMVMENVPDMVSMVTPEGLNVVDAFCQVLADGDFAPFDALKRSLLASSDAGAALRSGRPPGGKRERRADADTAKRPVVEGEQETLFG